MGAGCFGQVQGCAQLWCMGAAGGMDWAGPPGRWHRCLPLPMLQAERALRVTQGDMERAANWLVETGG